VQAGDLVEITRASIGVPKGTIGLIIKTTMSSPNAYGATYFIHEIQLCGTKAGPTTRPQGGNRLFLEKDLNICGRPASN
jgi:hypothetical protein